MKYYISGNKIGYQTFLIWRLTHNLPNNKIKNNAYTYQYCKSGTLKFGNSKVKKNI